MNAHDIADVFRLFTALGSFITVVILACKWRAWKASAYPRRLMALGLVSYATATTLGTLDALSDGESPGVHVYVYALATWFSIAGAYALDARKGKVVADADAN